MTDTSQVPDVNDAGETNNDDRQDIFDVVFHRLMDGFGGDCEEHGVKLAFVVAVHPDKHNPMIFYRGETIDVMSLLASILRDYKTSLYEQLDAEPKAR